MNARRVLVVGLIVLVSAGGTAANASEHGRTAMNRVVRCHVRADFNILISSARDMTCRAAAREMRRYRGSIARRFTTPGGFRCYRVSGSRLAGQWRCVRGGRAFRFEFSD
ncbi:MAG: hypothetical protein M3R70_08610 [Actinomycetota bacterium]|nr:hypothetical protein [Actinomycetota bacterium]